jgi:hypothetical protein
MKNFSLFAAANPILTRVVTRAAALAVFLAFFSSVPTHAQLNAPVVIKTPTLKVASAKGNWLKGEVIRADANSIVVREQNNGMMIHTFTYTPDVQVRMEKLIDQGGYQYGDKVKILYQQGQTVALKVRGKPSKAI